MRKCQIDGCDRAYLAKGMCRPHYEKARRVPKPSDRGPIEERFWKKVIVGQQPNDCWSWSGSKSPAGYPMLWGGKELGRPTGAHRVSYRIHHGEIPEGGLIMHSCDNPICCNPKHLLLGDDRSNCLDKVSKRRHYFGVSHHCAKLTEETVKYIRGAQAAALSNAALGKMMGVSSSVISSIRNRRTWKHLG